MILLSQVIQSRVTVLSNIPAMVSFFGNLPEFNLNLFVFEKNKSTMETSQQVLKELGVRLEEMTVWNGDQIKKLLMDYGTQAGLKVGTVMWPLRVALSGQQFTPGGAIEIAEILGKPETLRRIKLALDRY